MARITQKNEEPEEQAQAKADEVPEQRQERSRRDEETDLKRQEERLERREERQERQMGELAREIDPAPRLVVLGHMDSQIAVRLGWRKGMTAMSLSRFRFLRDDLGFEVTDEEENYLF